MGSLNVADVFDKFLPEYEKKHIINSYHRGVIDSIQKCRTKHMGGHWKVCTNCGETKKHYNSCGNRHCPTCQGINKEKWILEREYDLLPVRYFHVVFTVPAELRVLFICNQKLLYNLLFKSAWKTIDEFAQDPRQRMMAKTGMIAILHTWTQKLLYHPHVHCIVPAGGIDKQNQWKQSKGSSDFLFYTPNVASKFRGKFLSHLNELYQNNKLILNGKANVYKHKKQWCKLKDRLYNTNWVVNCKEPFKGPETVLEYLGRYTHKIAISNYRIKDITQTHVGFPYLDRNDGNKKKYLEIPGEKFISRFLCHIVPYRFVRIRHYGFLSTRTKKQSLQAIRRTLKASQPQKHDKLTIREVIMLVYGQDIHICQTCKQGVLLAYGHWTKNKEPPAQIGIVA
ncbi:MAG: IS91 family transposase [Salinivirgaceae bacterium]|jgi:hypothetical protein|nr:IS91 family transposase [Salinivirgaceae bacterium]